MIAISLWKFVPERAGMKLVCLSPIFSVCMSAMQNVTTGIQDVLSANETGIGGFKEIIFSVKGQGLIPA